MVPTEFLPGTFNPFERKVSFQRKPSEFEERLLNVKRVIKVTKGGRRFKFSALVVVGNKNGMVGYAVAKSIEVPDAIKTASRLAKRNLFKVKIVGNQATVPHEARGHHGAANVLLKPAVEGKGIIASNVVRAVVELAGYRNISSKNLGTNNPLNVVQATIDGLLQMKTKQEYQALRDKKI